MKLFLDTAEIEEIRTAARWGVQFRADWQKAQSRLGRS